jgi:hypothetical protein
MFDTVGPMDRRTPTLRTLAGTAVAAIVLSAGAGGVLAADLPQTATTLAGAAAPTPTTGPGGTDAPAGTEPAVTQPAPAEQAPDPAPPAEPAPITPDDNDLLQGILVPVGLLLAAAAVIAVIAALVRSRKPTPQSGTRRSPATPSPQASLLSTAQWINDQLSLELMAASPEAATQRWSIERSRLDNVAIGAQQQFLQTGGADWQLLGQAMSALAIALDTNVRLRTQRPPNADLIGESNTVVNRQRAELRELIMTMHPTIQR